MRQYQQERLWNQIKYSFASIILISIVTIILIKENLSLLNKYLRMREVRGKTEQDLGEVNKSNLKATNKLKNISSERGVEGYIRQAYPVVKNGESVITLYNSSSSNFINVEIEPSLWNKLSTWLKQVYDNAIIDYTNSK